MPIAIALQLSRAVWITYAVVSRHREEPDCTGITTIDGTRPGRKVPDGQFGPPVGEEIRILAGANRSLVDHAGKLWNADAGFRGGSAVKSTVQHVGQNAGLGLL